MKSPAQQRAAGRALIDEPIRNTAHEGAQRAARAADLAPILTDIKAAGASSLREIAAGLNARKIRTARGGEWSAVQVKRVLGRASA